MSTEIQTAREWAAALSAADCELIVHGALREHDMKAVVGAMRLLAVKDPRRAQALFDIIEVALAIRKTGAAEVAAELRAVADLIDSPADDGHPVIKAQTSL